MRSMRHGNCCANKNDVRSSTLFDLFIGIIALGRTEFVRDATLTSPLGHAEVIFGLASADGRVLGGPLCIKNIIFSLVRGFPFFVDPYFLIRLEYYLDWLSISFRGPGRHGLHPCTCNEVRNYVFGMLSHFCYVVGMNSA